MGSQKVGQNLNYRWKTQKKDPANDSLSLEGLFLTSSGFDESRRNTLVDYPENSPESFQKTILKLSSEASRKFPGEGNLEGKWDWTVVCYH